MITQYKFEYDNGNAEIHFNINTNIFTKELAQENLDFFIWDYDESENPITAIIKKYAIQAIKIGCINDYNINGIKNEFRTLEGFYKVDGTNGIELTHITNYDFDDNLLIEII